LKIKVDDIGRTFECALHFAAYSGLNLLIVSFAGPGTAVQAVKSNIAAGRKTRIFNEDDEEIGFFDPPRGMYRSMERKSGDVFHAIVLHKSAVFNENPTNPTIIAPDGDIRTAVGRFITSKFAVPSEWETQYLDLLEYQEATTICSPHIKAWQNARVIEITGVKGSSTDQVTDETLVESIESALHTGQLKIPESEVKGRFDPEWTMKEYLRENAKILADQVKKIKPRHNFGNLDRAIGEMERIPFPAQGHVIQGMVNTLKEQDMAIASCDMGTGKSIMSLGVVNILHHQRGKGPMSVLLTAPSNTIPKWATGEIQSTLPDAKVRIIKTFKDAIRYAEKVKQGYQPKGLEFVLLSLDRAKLGPEPWCAATWKRVSSTNEYAWHCPDCGEPLPDPDHKKEDFLRWHGFACGTPPIKKTNLLPNGLPKGFIPKWIFPSKTRKCPYCETPLWRPALKQRGETNNKPRWYISFIFRQLKKHFDLYIADEVHQAKAADSGRGDAFVQLLKASKKVLCLTGTLVNGMSTSVKELLWRTDPKSLIREGFDFSSGTIKWAQEYGVLERVTRLDDGYDEGVVTRRKKNVTTKEKPGIAPELVVTHLLHRAAFLELKDLELPLPELNEVPVIITPDDDHLDAYKTFHTELRKACGRAYAAGVPGAYSRFLPETLGYANTPHLGAEVTLREGSEEEELIYAPAFPEDYYNAKEREMVRIVQDNLAQDRGCIIYCYHTQQRKSHHRIRQVLEDHSIESHVLESGVSPEKRIEWLARKEEEGAKVIICNNKLVEHGLDLLAWPTIINMELSDDINTLRQANRRNWRYGATRECRIYYLVNNQTQEMIQFKRCMLKRAHALMTEGRLDRSELASYGRDERTSLAADLADCLAEEGMEDRWKELAAKDVEDVETVKEKDFMSVLNETKHQLALKTLKLCGFSEEEINEALGEPEDAETFTRPTMLELAAFLPKKKKKPRKKTLPEGYVQPALF